LLTTHHREKGEHKKKQRRKRESQGVLNSPKWNQKGVKEVEKNRSIMMPFRKGDSLRTKRKEELPEKEGTSRDGEQPVENGRERTIGKTYLG